MIAREKFLAAARAFLAKMPVAFRPRIAAACPFCEALGHVRVYAAGEHGEDSAAVVHEMPACAEFVELEAYDFMERARLRLQLQVSN